MLPPKPIWCGPLTQLRSSTTDQSGPLWDCPGAAETPPIDIAPLTVTAMTSPPSGEMLAPRLGHVAYLSGTFTTFVRFAPAWKALTRLGVMIHVCPRANP